MSTTQALEQGIQRAKNCWPQGSPDEARSSPGNDSGNRHALLCLLLAWQWNHDY